MGAPSATPGGAARPSRRSGRSRTSRAGCGRGGTRGAFPMTTSGTRLRSWWGRHPPRADRGPRRRRGAPRGCAASSRTARRPSAPGPCPPTHWRVSTARASRGCSRGRGCRCAPGSPRRGPQWRARASTRCRAPGTSGPTARDRARPRSRCPARCGRGGAGRTGRAPPSRRVLPSGAVRLARQGLTRFRSSSSVKSHSRVDPASGPDPSPVTRPPSRTNAAGPDPAQGDAAG